MVSGYNLTMEPGTAKNVCFGLTANNVTVKLINKLTRVGLSNTRLTTTQRLSKRQTLLRTTVLLKTSFTFTIKIDDQKCFLLFYNVKLVKVSDGIQKGVSSCVHFKFSLNDKRLHI